MLNDVHLDRWVQKIDCSGLSWSRVCFGAKWSGNQTVRRCGYQTTRPSGN